MTTTVNQLLHSKSKPDIIYSVEPDMKVFDAIRMMNDKKVGALPVMESGKLVGIISERDYTRKVILNNLSSKDTNVSKIMTSDVKTVKASQTVDECLLIMSNNHIRHLPVVDDDGNPISILSVMDVVKNILVEKEFIIEQLEHYITDTA